MSGSTTRTMRSLAAEKRAIRSLNKIRSRREADTFLPCRSEIAELVDGQPDRGEGKILEPLGEHLLQKIFVGEADGHVRAEVLADLRGDESCDVVDRRSLPIRLSPTATSGSVRPCSWTFTSVAIFGSHNRCQSSSDFSLTMRPVPATWRRLAGATGSFAPIVRRRESRSASQIVLASCAAAGAAVIRR